MHTSEPLFPLLLAPEIGLEPLIRASWHATYVTQGESLWLHLDIIKALAKMCHEVFEGGDVKYAFTTIPTYPR